MKKLILALAVALSAQAYSQTILDPNGEVFQDTSTAVNRGFKILMSLEDSTYYDAESDSYWHEFHPDYQTAYYAMMYLVEDPSLGCSTYTAKEFRKYANKQVRKGLWSRDTKFEKDVSDYCACENEFFSLYMYVFKDGFAFGAIVN